MTEGFICLTGEASVHLLERMLAFDPGRRCSAEEALTHEYFADLQLPAPDEPGKQVDQQNTPLYICHHSSQDCHIMQKYNLADSWLPYDSKSSVPSQALG